MGDSSKQSKQQTTALNITKWDRVKRIQNVVLNITMEPGENDSGAYWEDGLRARGRKAEQIRICSLEKKIGSPPPCTIQNQWHLHARARPAFFSVVAVGPKSEDEV
jgi:hypothetical protein